MFEEDSIRKSKKINSHLIFICDENGIFDSFRELKEHLGSRGEIYLSLLYCVPEDYHNHLFEKEITILEKRFSHNLFTSIVKVKSGIYDLIQEFIEAIINSNTNLKMQFLIFGNAEFVDYVTGVLDYLNIDTFSIESNIILNQ